MTPRRKCSTDYGSRDFVHEDNTNNNYYYKESKIIEGPALNNFQLIIAHNNFFCI